MDTSLELSNVMITTLMITMAVQTQASSTKVILALANRVSAYLIAQMENLLLLSFAMTEILTIQMDARPRAQ